MSEFIHFDERDTRMRTSRSGGPGGQNVNMRATRVQIWIPVAKLKIDEAAKRRLMERLKNRISKDGELEVSSEVSRSLEQNRDDAYARLDALVDEAIRENQLRIPTEVPRPAKEEAVREHKLRYTRKKERRISKTPPEDGEEPLI